MTMRILYDHQIFSLQRYGGISRYFYELIIRTADDPNVAVSLFLGLHINEYGIDALRGRCEHYCGWKRPAIPRIIGPCNRLNDVLFAFAADKWRSDVYHPTYYADLANRCRGKRIVTVFDMIHERHPSSFSPRDTDARDKALAVSRADGIICISEATKRDLMQYLRVPERKIRVIYLANSIAEPAGGNSFDGRPYLLYVGQRYSYKNFLPLLALYAEDGRINRQYDLVCFGGGPLTKAEKDIIEKNRVTGKVRAVSGTDATLANLYSHAAVLIYPSLYEGFGIPPLEAMHYGCPVLASDTSSIPEVVGEGGLYFSPTDPDDLKSKLDRLLTDSTLRDTLVRRGYAREKQFSWDSTAADTLRFYHEIAGCTP